jgi:hypothetical protein
MSERPPERAELDAEGGARFCPRCGTALVPGLPFCPKCGFDSAEIGGAREPTPERSDGAIDGFGSQGDVDPEATARSAVADVGYPRSARAPSRGSQFLFGAVIIAVGLIVFGFLMRPVGVGGPSVPGLGGSGQEGQSGSGGSQGVPSAPIVGITIQNPQDGAVVATKDVTVIGIAPPGLSITRDVSFGLDQHATVDGTGHWAMSVELKEGQNDLVFRIGDDRSTERRLRVVFTLGTAS